MRARRLALQQQWAWTVAADSPLSTACQAEWLTWLKSLHRWTIDFARPDDVVALAQPQLVYDEGEE